MPSLLIINYTLLIINYTLLIMLLEIVSPESKLFQGEVTSVFLPGVAGSFQVLNHHAPIVSTLKEGVETAASVIDQGLALKKLEALKVTSHG